MLTVVFHKKQLHYFIFFSLPSLGIFYFFTSLLKIKLLLLALKASFYNYLMHLKDTVKRHWHVHVSRTKVSDLEALSDNLPGFWHFVSTHRTALQQADLDSESDK